MTGLKQILLSCLGPLAAKHSSRPGSSTGQHVASREAERKLLSNSCLSQAGFVPKAGSFVWFKYYLTMDVFIIHIHVTLLSTLRRVLSSVHLWSRQLWLATCLLPFNPCWLSL